MLYGLLLTFYIFIATLIIILVFVQPSKSSMGLGAMGGGTQMLFGGSGGQNIFQKITWFLATMFMILSLGLALMKSSKLRSRYLGNQNQVSIQQDPQATETPDSDKESNE